MPVWLIPIFVAWFVFCAWIGIRNFDKQRGAPAANPFEPLVLWMLTGLGGAAVGVVTSTWIVVGLGAVIFLAASARYYFGPRRTGRRSS
jgi:hypothetical protein